MHFHCALLQNYIIVCNSFSGESLELFHNSSTLRVLNSNSQYLQHTLLTFQDSHTLTPSTHILAYTALRIHPSICPTLLHSLWIQSRSRNSLSWLLSKIQHPHPCSYLLYLVKPKFQIHLTKKFLCCWAQLAVFSGLSYRLPSKEKKYASQCEDILTWQFYTVKQSLLTVSPVCSLSYFPGDGIFSLLPHSINTLFHSPLPHSQETISGIYRDNSSH